MDYLCIVKNHEKNLPAQKTKKKNDTRLFSEDKIGNREESSSEAPSKRQEKTLRLIMLPRRERIMRAGFPKGRGGSTPFSFGTVRVFPSETFRGSVVISKKTIRSAVKRHKGKRKGYQALKALRGLGAVSAYVFYPNQNVLSESVSGMILAFKKRFR